MTSQDWALAMGVEDDPDGTGGKLPRPSANAPNAGDTLAGKDPLHQDVPLSASGKTHVTSVWRQGNRAPARGLLLAIPAGIALWAVAIYLVANFL